MPVPLREDDIALAQAVPGIDIIFGTHSHRKEDLFKIPGTSTWMISPFQYATYVSKLELQFNNGGVGQPHAKGLPRALRGAAIVRGEYAGVCEL